MVAIRRKPRRSSSNSIWSNGTVRAVIFGIAVLAGVRWLLGGNTTTTTGSSSGTSENTNPNSNNNNPNMPQRPRADSAIHAALKDSSIRLGNKARSSRVDRTDKKPEVQKQDEFEFVKEPLLPEAIDVVDELDEERQAQVDHLENTANNEKLSVPLGSLSETTKNKASSSSNANDVVVVLKKLGTGPTQLGYVVDLAYERNHPAFRNNNNNNNNNKNSILQTTFDDNYFSKLEQLVLKKVQDQLPASVTLQACEQLVPSSEEDGTTSTSPNLQLRSKCYDDDTRLIVYNGAEFGRHVCGHLVEPGSALVLKEDCHFLSWTFPTTSGVTTGGAGSTLAMDNPPVTGEGMPPIQIVFHKPDPQQQQQQQQQLSQSMTRVTCDIPCEWESILLTNPTTAGAGYRFVVGTNWKITYATDQDHDVSMEPTAYRHDHYYATPSWESSIPLSSSSFSLDQYNLRNTTAIDFDQANNAATCLLNDKCSSGSSRRHRWMGAAKVNLKQVHFYGSCEHNTPIPNGLSLDKLEDRLALMKRDRIVLAYEESMEPYHITSIVWEALLSGAVPAILGASNLESDHMLPKHAALYASEYNSWDEYSKYIQKVADDQELWQSFQSWRTDEVALNAFEERWNFTRTSAQCRLCRWAYAKKYGLGWNHVQQTVQPNRIPRQLCVSTATTTTTTTTTSTTGTLLVTQPFRESWQIGDQEITTLVSKANQASSSCPETPLSAMIVDGLERWVWYHDGFTDVIIRRSSTTTTTAAASAAVDSEPIRLRLHVNVLNNEGALFRHVHTLLVPNPLRTPLVSSVAIQDEQAKVTVLANFVVEFTSPHHHHQPGWLEVEIPITPTTPTPTPLQPTLYKEYKLRIITEDFHPLHDKLTEYYPSSYAQMVMKDFIDPLDVFYMAPSSSSSSSLS